jgi:hypothetical protein
MNDGNSDEKSLDKRHLLQRCESIMPNLTTNDKEC